MRKVILFLAVVLGCGAAAGWAQAQTQEPLLPPAAAPSVPDTRWSFRRVDDGFIRLDNQTGQIAHCTPRDASWACQAVPQDRAALEKQVADLKAEIASLKKEIAALRAAATPPPPQPQERGPGVSLRIPTQEDVARARDYLADTWQHLVQMIMNFQRDVLRKS